MLIALLIHVFVTDWKNFPSILAFICAAFGTMASVLSLFIPNHYIFKFRKDDWVVGEDGNKKIVIGSRKHGLGKSPKAELFFKDDNGNYQSVLTTPQVDNDGNITITVQCGLCEGKVVIK